MQVAEAIEYVLNKLKRELSPMLTFHNLEHTLDVFNAANSLCESEGVGEFEGKLVQTAAIYHDVGFTIEGAGHEEHSCAIAKESLPRYGYSDDAIEIICGIIKATKVPQQPENHLQQIICDADLDYLGRDDYTIISTRLYEELINREQISSESEWLDLQINFLQNHRYFTETSKSLRSEKKEENLHRLINWREKQV